MHKYFLFFLVCFSLTFISCKTDTSVTSEPNETDRNVLLDNAFSEVKSNTRIKSFIVLTTDSSYYKEQFDFPSSKTSLHDVMSVTKSVLSILVGIAIEKGFIPSVNETIDKYIRPIVPQLDSAKGTITIRQLLSMSCGLAWSEIPGPSEFIDWYYYSPDHLLYILNKPFTSNPGEVFNYSDGAAHIMSVVLSRATGMTAKEFAEEYLFTPLGIDQRNWTVDNRCYNFGGVRLFLLPSDMVKIGKLIIQKGEYNSRRIVSDEWVRISTGFQITTNNIIPYGSDYGFYWWREALLTI